MYIYIYIYIYTSYIYIYSFTLTGKKFCTRNKMHLSTYYILITMLI